MQFRESKFLEMLFRFFHSSFNFKNNNFIQKSVNYLPTVDLFENTTVYRNIIIFLKDLNIFLDFSKQGQLQIHTTNMLSYVPVFYFIVSMTQFYPIVITQLINNEVLASNIKSGNLSQLVCPETQILLVIAYAIRYASAISYFGFRQEEILTEVLKSVQIMSWVFLFLRLISKKQELQIDHKTDFNPTFIDTLIECVSGPKIVWNIFIGFFFGIVGNYFKMLDANNLLDYKVVLMDVGAIIARLAIIPQCIHTYQQMKTNIKFSGKEVFLILRWIFFFGISKGFYIADEASEIGNGRALFLALIFEVAFLVSTLIVVTVQFCKKKGYVQSQIDYPQSEGSFLSGNDVEKIENQNFALYAKI